jgi:hypothetical protein
MKGWLFVTAMFMVVVVSLPIYAASPSEVYAAPFRNIGHLGVLVEDLGEEGKRAGITQDKVRVLVEQRLQQGGILASSTTERGPESPYLYVTVNLMYLERINHFVFSIRLDLAQTVKLLRTDVTLTGAKTWSQEVIGITSAEKVRTAVKGNLDDLLTLFLGEYSATNLPVSTRNHHKTEF